MPNQSVQALNLRQSAISATPLYLASQSAVHRMPCGRYLTAEAMGTDQILAYGADRYRRISSKYIVPEPPATGLALLPRPRVIVLTLARFTPWSAKA